MKYHLPSDASVTDISSAVLPICELKEVINKNLIKVWNHFPQEFDETLFDKRDLLFFSTSTDFKQHRSQKHLCRIIFSLFLLQNSLRKLVTLHGEKQHIQFRLLQTILTFPFGYKSVLSFVGGICLFDEQEIFKKKHLLLAAQKFIPTLQIVQDSFFLHHNPEDSIQLMYVEFEKKGGGSFNREEIACLKKKLAVELQGCIEKNIPALFMKRNEEEILKNILTLSKELDFSYDIPEMIIDFEQLTHSYLYFTIILVRVLNEESKTIEELFHSLPNDVHCILDRKQIVGYLNNSYPKEAAVFRLEIPHGKDFLRSDFSIDFYLARQKVKSIFLDVIGNIRDFNGGMILKQRELLSQFKETFHEISKSDPLLIENFFYSLSPIEKQITIPLNLLSTLFALFLEVAKADTFSNPFVLKIWNENKNVFAVLKSEDFSLFKILENIFKPLLLKENFVTFQLDLKQSFVAGFIQNKEKCPEQTLDISSKLEEEIIKWDQVRQNRQIAKLAIRYVPTSLDPRVGGDEHSRVLLKMLFEGLMRIGKDGKPTYALAESVTISSDKKTYVFHLRKSFWSDETLLIAYDFEYAWKKILSPEFKTQFASLFSPLKNARLVKQGTKSLEELGVKALDALTLRVVLENPTPYFLELVTLPLFSPIPHQVDQKHPNWAFQEADAYISNGPFCLKRRNLSYGFEFIKNFNYWDKQSVALDQIFIRKINDSSVYDMFGNGSIDWIGRLLPYWDPACARRYPTKMSSHYSTKVSWCVFNTHYFPFTNKKIRKGLSYCIDKEELISLLNYEDALPAISPLPLKHTKQAFTERDKFNPEYAREIFNEGLIELGIKKTDFPLITFLAPAFFLHKQTAQLIIQQWETILGVTCRLIFMEWPEIFRKICDGHYEICLITWTPQVNDPIYTLNAFKYSDDEINHSKWENPSYQNLLDKAIQEEEPFPYLNAAERILIDEMPVIPLFFEQNQYIRQEYFHVPCDPLYGYPDFKWAYIDKTKEKK